MQEVCCRDSDRMRSPAPKGFVCVFKFEYSIGCLLEERSRLVCRYETECVFVASLRTIIDTDWFYWRYLETMCALYNVECCIDGAESCVGCVLVIWDYLSIDVVLLLAKADGDKCNVIERRSLYIGNQLFFTTLKEKVGGSECVRVDLCPIGMVYFKIVFLCELVPFNTAISYKPTRLPQRSEVVL